jgi:hypothetical protein
MEPQVGDVYLITTNNIPSITYGNRKGETITIAHIDDGVVYWTVSWWNADEYGYYDCVTTQNFSKLHEKMKLQLVMVKEPTWTL